MGADGQIDSNKILKSAAGFAGKSGKLADKAGFDKLSAGLGNASNIGGAVGAILDIVRSIKAAIDKTQALAFHEYAQAQKMKVSTDELQYLKTLRLNSKPFAADEELFAAVNHLNQMVDKGGESLTSELGKVGLTIEHMSKLSGYEKLRHLKAALPNLDVEKWGDQENYLNNLLGYHAGVVKPFSLQKTDPFLQAETDTKVSSNYLPHEEFLGLAQGALADQIPHRKKPGDWFSQMPRILARLDEKVTELSAFGVADLKAERDWRHWKRNEPGGGKYDFPTDLRSLIGKAAAGFASELELDALTNFFKWQDSEREKHRREDPVLPTPKEDGLGDAFSLLNKMSSGQQGALGNKTIAQIGAETFHAVMQTPLAMSVGQILQAASKANLSGNPAVQNASFSSLDQRTVPPIVNHYNSFQNSITVQAGNDERIEAVCKRVVGGLVQQAMDNLSSDAAEA